ncbi:unnamed protein product, partial [Laminaria digitata]
MRANLMPVPVIKEAMWKRKVPYFATAAGLAAAAAGAMFIRPLLDDSAFQGASKPPLISSVSREASSLADEAEQVGVTDSAQADLRGAEIVGLLDARALYTNILEDTARLIDMVAQNAQNAAASDERLAAAIKDRQALKLVALNNEYLSSPDAGNAPAATGRPRFSTNDPV